ncbi:MAG: DUF4139 domain-containing protein [Sporocytophaga sp.]|uniref:DUF4139 domain-containing protein n=1 Tax=Sporocytophaga sp. TaxID=2231183 RepID=UPI001B1F83C2|nr:DUF4139 domain-containing protein [Sporocytophaga sp.]MBO9702268.1 DUF4139 domain-containing protein [Sporocytophaga sp.]
MKRLCIFILLLAQIQAFADDKKNLKADIKQVTVFLNKAQVTSLLQTSLEEGTNELIVDGLPAGIDKQSIQVSGKGNFVIMSVKHDLNYIDPQKKSTEMIALEDSIRFYRVQARKMKSLNDVLLKEEQMILTNKDIKGEKQTITADQLEDVADFYRERLEDVRFTLIDNDDKLKELNEKATRFQQQLDDLFNERNKNTSKISISVSARSAGNVQLELLYVVNDAGWTPLYDIRAKDTKSPVQVNYKAHVYQNTGLDWNNARLKLSTANPTLGLTKPDLDPWYLDFYIEPPIGSMNEFLEPEVAKDEEVVYKGIDADTADLVLQEVVIVTKSRKNKLTFSKPISDFTEVVENTVSVEFDIALPYTILSGNNPQLVDIQSHEVKADYEYFSIPKLDQDAFLVAHVTDWETLNLLSGNANIFFEGTFVGESFINAQNTSDTLSLSLGRDSKVVVKRNKLKEFTRKNFVGLNKKEEHAFEIEVRNTKKESISVLVEDQIPVSQNNQIEVELIDGGGAIFDKVSGKLQWKLNIGAGETKKVLFKYSLKYPKNKIVSGL